MLNQTIELACDLFCVVAQFFKRVLINIALIFGDVELAANFAGGCFGLAEVVDKLALSPAFESLGALTAGKKCSWGAMFDMTLTAAR
nr:hypothetical protein [Salinibacter altiplanensis]